MLTLDLLTVGRTGNGKSSTGNSILGKKAFTPKSSSSSPEFVPDVILKDSAEIDGNTITVVDGPGLGDTGLDDSSGVESAIAASRKAVKSFTGGFHALLIVLKYGVRFTKQEKDAIKMIKSIFGEDVVKNHGVIIMTHGESFDLDMEDESTTFEEWCKQQTGDVQGLFTECNHRCVLFSNRAKEDRKLKEQYGKLLSMVMDIQSSRPPYTMEDFGKAESSRTKLRIESQLPELRKKTDKIVDRVDREASQIEDKPERERLEKLERLKDMLAEHKAELETIDQGTGALKQLFMQLSVSETSIKTKIRLCRGRIKEEETRLAAASYQQQKQTQEPTPPSSQWQSRHEITPKMKIFIIVGILTLALSCLILYFACDHTCLYIGIGISFFTIFAFLVYFFVCRDRRSTERIPTIGRDRSIYDGSS